MNQIAELEETLANASYAHEYSLKKLETIRNHSEADAILDELSYYTTLYAETRRQFAVIDSERLQHFETELIWQKNTTLRGVMV